MKIIAVAADDFSLLIFHLDMSQAFMQAPVKEKIYMRLPPKCGELSGNIVMLLKCDLV